MMNGTDVGACDGQLSGEHDLCDCSTCAHVGATADLALRPDYWHAAARAMGSIMTLARRLGDLDMAKTIMCDVIWYRQRARALRAS